MTTATRLLASAVVGSLMVGGTAVSVRAQSVPSRSPVPPAARAASFAPGSILGMVQDERGLPVAGVVVSALGATTTVAVTDKNGRFEFGTLSPGPYLLRAHHSGFVAPRAMAIQVSPSARSTPAIGLRRVGSVAPVLAAGIAVAAEPEPEVASAQDDDLGTEPAVPAAENETVWRIRHARRSVLKEATVPAEWLVDTETPGSGFDGWTTIDVITRAFGSPARAAGSFFVDTPFSGQVNLLTSGSFNSAQQLMSAENVPQNIAYGRLGAPVGDQADWSVRGALTQADISSWIVAGAYTMRAPARHRYDVGLSYATQRYDGGNLLALHDVTDGTRNAAEVYGFDSLSLSPALTMTYGGTFARYDYLEGRSLLSPRLEVTLVPAAGFRLSGAIARRALAPGAEEFLPPVDTGLWLPPQRTFSSLDNSQGFEAEHTTHAEVAAEKDLGNSTVAFRAFRQRVDNQLVTLFGAEVPGRPAAKLGHYLVGNAGDATATGCSVALRTVIAGRVRGGVEYTMANAQLTPDRDVRYLMLVAPSGVRVARERIHDISTSLETEVPETATRVLVFYRLSNGFAHPGTGSEAADRPALDGRFDIQVRQSLPFMNFSSARWEMLLAVRNFFRETGTDQSIYDELMVVRPPKRVVGGVTLRF